MKILQLNISDVQGGASIACYRLHKALQRQNIDSHMLVRDKKSTDPSISSVIQSNILNVALCYLDHLPLLAYPHRQYPLYNLQWVPDFLIPKVKKYNPDILHIHWINDGFINIGTLSQIQIPIVWTLHDAWAFTGGCHYPGSCVAYQEQCGDCLQLQSKKSDDLSRWVWKRKMGAWKDTNFTIIVPSRWLGKLAQASSLFKHFKIEVLPNGIDSNIFQPCPVQETRKIMGLPIDKKLILFGGKNATNDKRKGFHYLIKALNILTEKSKLTFEVAVFGSQCDPKQFIFPIHNLGTINDEKLLARVYASCDVFIAPSLEDNLPNTVIESLSCGTPVVAFNIGGMPDMIDHQINGYLAKPYESEDLAQGIYWILSDEQRLRWCREMARKKVENEFDIHISTQKHIVLYNEVVSAPKRKQ